MARYQLKDYIPKLANTFTHSNYFTPGVTFRLAMADTFGISTDEKNKGWLKYASEGDNFPAKHRLLYVWNYPYFIVGLLRSGIMKGIDWLAMGGKMSNEIKTPPVAFAVKLIIGLPLLMVETGFFILSKVMDIPEMLGAIYKKWKKNKTEKQGIEIKKTNMTTSIIEKDLSTPSHALHIGAEQKPKTPASVACNPLFPAGSAKLVTPKHQASESNKPVPPIVVTIHRNKPHQ